MNREARIRQWHRLFGIALTDVLTDTPWRVELERELALQSQLLDVLIIEQDTALTCAPGIAAYGLPDGLEGLRAHNLLTYKSAHEAMDSWALEELLGHYVNYRKQISGKGKLIAPERFQLYAVATRYPRDLAQQWPLQATAWPGVFDLAWASHRLRLIVLNQIAPPPGLKPGRWGLSDDSPAASLGESLLLSQQGAEALPPIARFSGWPAGICPDRRPKRPEYCRPRLRCADP